MNHGLMNNNREMLRADPGSSDGLEVFLYKYLSSIVSADADALSSPDFDLYMTGIRPSNRLSKDLQDVLNVF